MAVICVLMLIGVGLLFLCRSEKAKHEEAARKREERAAKRRTGKFVMED